MKSGIFFQFHSSLCHNVHDLGLPVVLLRQLLDSVAILLGHIKHKQPTDVLPIFQRQPTLPRFESAPAPGNICLQWPPRYWKISLKKENFVRWHYLQEEQEVGKLLQKHHLVSALNYLIKSFQPSISLPPSSSCCWTQAVTSENILSSGTHNTAAFSMLKIERPYGYYSIRQIPKVTCYL